MLCPTCEHARASPHRRVSRYGACCDNTTTVSETTARRPAVQGGGVQAKVRIQVVIQVTSRDYVICNIFGEGCGDVGREGEGRGGNVEIEKRVTKEVSAS